MKGRAHSLPFTALFFPDSKQVSIYCWVDRESFPFFRWPGSVAQWVGHLTRKSGVLGSIPGLATYFRFSFRFFKKGSCQLLAKVCARSTGEPLWRSKPA